MTVKEKLDAANARQQEILDASRAAGNEALTDSEQKEFDALTAQINALKDVDATDAVNNERARVSAINEACRSFNMDPTPYINGGNSIEEVKSSILETLKKTSAPIYAGSIEVTDEADTFRAAATDALCMRAGVNVQNPVKGANELRGYSLKDLARESLEREGRKASHDTDALLRAFNPESSFPAILDAAIQKSIVEVYKEIPTTFDKWTSKGSLSDFKASKDREYILGSFSAFEEVPENGELKGDNISTAVLPTRQLKEYGKSFSMTRKAFIDDDIGFISKLPGAYAKAAKMTIEKQVYSVLFNNEKFSGDGKALFHADHKNLITAASKPTQATIQDAITLGRKQTSPFGEAIFWSPKYIIVPIGYEFDLATIFRSAQVTGSNNNDINPLYNYPIEIIQVPTLNTMAGSSACPWFVVAGTDSCRGVQVDYLNGQEAPTVRRMEKPGVLGFHWDIWLDWGVSVADYRGLVKHTGVAL
jgi:hypothetical protein